MYAILNMEKYQEVLKPSQAIDLPDVAADSKMIIVVNKNQPVPTNNSLQKTCKQTTQEILEVCLY